MFFEIFQGLFDLCIICKLVFDVERLVFIVKKKFLIEKLLYRVYNDGYDVFIGESGDENCGYDL